MANNTITQEEMAKFKTYTTKEAEQILHVSHRTVMQYIAEKRIKAVKVGGLWRISEKNLMDFINGD